jgi:hypothetical protein
MGKLPNLANFYFRIWLCFTSEFGVFFVFCTKEIFYLNLQNNNVALLETTNSKKRQSLK